jgi:AAHS family 4-hydroxybenzoate transporter-like MFS transporter
MACLVMDGFDVQVLGYTAPSIVREWGVAAATPRAGVAAAQFRRAARRAVHQHARRPHRTPPCHRRRGALCRRDDDPDGHVTSVPQLLLMRFLTGIGLGTIVSNASSLVGE